jgi:hypothetical protein
MKTHLFFASLAFTFIVYANGNQASAREISGPYRVGYRKETLSTTRQSNGERVDLLLNIWYPTQDNGKPVRLLDFTWLHLMTGEPGDSLKLAEENSLNKSVSQWYGKFEEEQWAELSAISSNSQLNAAFINRRFPLIIGRLRAFSTTHTVEELASHGFIICMLTGVDDYPPDNHEAFLRQVSDEIDFFLAIKKYFSKELNLSQGKAGLLGFSGNGISPFIAAMHTDAFSSLVLLESGVFLKDIYEIIQLHPFFSKRRFDTDLLFLYNRQRFEKEQMKTMYDELPAKSKQLLLVDNEAQHHWDFATEGTIASKYLKNRAEEISVRQLDEFKKINQDVVNFFKRTLKENN